MKINYRKYEHKHTHTAQHIYLSVMLKLVYIGFASMHSFDEFEMRLGDNENQLKDLLNREHGK